MGILDDAIREHLDLKRKRGASSGELEQLEKDAFGPPSRPGDEEPDEQAAAEAPVEVAEVAEEPAEVAEEPAEVAEEGDREELSAERAREEYPELDDTAAHAVLEPEQSEEGREAEAEPEPTQAEPEPADAEPVADAPVEEAPEAEIFDPEQDLADLDLDFEFEEEEPEDEGALIEEEEEAELPADAAIEHPIPQTEEHEPGGEEPEAEPFDRDPGEDVEGEGEEEEKGEEGEDLLEETPDFLKDAPEGDRLWFEQDAPRDFDFDEE